MDWFYLRLLKLFSDGQQPLVLISCVGVLNHRLHPGKGFLQPSFGLSPAFSQEIVVILVGCLIMCAGAISQSLRAEPSQAAPFSPPSQYNLLHDSH